jgi:hypothetical protein
MTIVTMGKRLCDGAIARGITCTVKPCTAAASHYRETDSRQLTAHYPDESSRVYLCAVHAQPPCLVCGQPTVTQYQVCASCAR